MIAAAGATSPWGSGSQAQALCPAFLPAPPGYVAWDTSVNGPIPANIQQQATALANDLTKPLGYTSTVYVSGIPVLVRVDAHTWTTDASGNEVSGCYHGADVWIPAVNVTPPSPSNSTTNTLLVASLGLGAAVSALTIYDFLRRPR